MPCWEINLMTVEFKIENIDLLLEILKELGYSFNVSDSRISFRDKQGRSYTIDTINKRVTMERSGSKIINEIKRKYSKKVMENMAKRNRWAVRTNPSSHNKYRLVRY